VTSRETSRLSVVVPVYNEIENLPDLFERLFPVLLGLDIPFEVVCVDDGSSDGSFEFLREERERRSALTVLSLSRNFGQHAAILAGFEAARGDWVITIDADLQNPPEEIPRLVAALEQGHDLVNTRRLGRQDSRFRRLASRLNAWATRRMTGIAFRDLGCMLRGYHRDIASRIVERGEIGSFVPALGAIYARNPVELAVSHEARAHGESKYSVWKLLRLQLDLMTTFTLTPLRLLMVIGALSAGLSMLFGIGLVVLRLMLGAAWAAEGVFTVFAALFFFVGAQFVALGLIGEYLGRIYLEVRKRPAFLVRESYPSRSPSPSDFKREDRSLAVTRAAGGERP
jgi:undecaprenyl-phosphate 4-deoxy-4-formamido-L-arabinose transferase